MIVSLLAGVTSLPIEHIAEVAAAKAEFSAAVAAAETGDHPGKSRRWWKKMGGGINNARNSSHSANLGEPYLFLSV